MRKLMLALAFAGGVLFAAQSAMAQCCDKVDLDGDPNTPAQGCGPAGAGNAGAGCVDAGGGTCAGGDATTACGCIGVAGGYLVDDDAGVPDDAGECARVAASACCDGVGADNCTP